MKSQQTCSTKQGVAYIADLDNSVFHSQLCLFHVWPWVGHEPLWFSVFSPVHRDSNVCLTGLLSGWQVFSSVWCFLHPPIHPWWRAEPGVWHQWGGNEGAHYASWTQGWREALHAPYLVCGPQEGCYERWAHREMGRELLAGWHLPSQSVRYAGESIRSTPFLTSAKYPGVHTAGLHAC